MVADDLATATARERELAARVRELEGQLQKPSLPPSDQDLMALLGEETARVLGQARESAVELRGKAEEHARRVVREAQETARELRTTTQQAVETKTREAEDAARARAKEIVGEARVLRERVLNDLNEHRQQLQREIADLRSGRGQLVESYQLVERALAHATRVMAEEPSTAPEMPATADAEPHAPATPEPGPATPELAPAPVEPEARAEEPRDAESDAPTPAGADVGALFEKLRSEHRDEPADAEPADAEPAGAQPVASEPPDPGPVEPGDVDPPAPAVGEEPAEPPDSAAAQADHTVTDARDSALADTTDDLVRRGKRALQDEQNDILDGLRRQRGKIDTSKVLPPLEDQLARWAHVLQPAVDSAYSAGAASTGGSVGAAPRGLLTELSTSTVAPLRDRLSSSIGTIEARTPADAEIAVAQRLGARYREWRGQELELVLGDAVAVAYSRGVYDSAPDGSRLRWIPAHEGKCPDCDDNALEPTVKGSEFPTGQPHPPAHPGCRCVLVIDASD
jgi:cell division septum initiation protein DivIVA